MTSLEAIRGRDEDLDAGTPAPRFFFIRHGETEWNREGRLQGQTDVALNGRGRDQAATVGRLLRRVAAERRLEPEDLDFVASPLARTRSTMELLRRAMNLEPALYRTERHLKEISFGTWEGLTWPQIAASHPLLHAERNRDRWAFVPPEGESYAQVADRVSPWLGTLRDNAVVVAHGGVARVLLVMLTGLDPKLAPRVDIWQGRILMFEAGTATWL